MKVGILGGSFDPVHNGHLALANAALKQLKLDCVYLVLSPRSPFKLDQQLTPVEQRLAMLEAAVKKQEGLRIGEWELKRRGPSYTVTTLAAYKKLHPSHKLFLILGSDAASRLNEWKDPQKITAMATLVIARRPGAPLELSNLTAQMTFLSGEYPDVSSTEIRTAVQNGQDIVGVPSAVTDVIKDLRLYEK